MVNNAQRTPQALEVVNRGMTLQDLIQKDRERIVAYFNNESITREERLQIWREMDSVLNAVDGGQQNEYSKDNTIISKMRIVRHNTSAVIQGLDQARKKDEQRAASLPAASTLEWQRIMQDHNEKQAGVRRDTQKNTWVHQNSVMGSPVRNQTILVETEGEGGDMEWSSPVVSNTPQAPSVQPSNWAQRANANSGKTQPSTPQQHQSAASAPATTQATPQNTTVPSARRHVSYTDQKIDIKRDDAWKLTAESMIDLLTDLDDMSGVEVQNRSRWRRWLFGGGSQKEIAGEQQLKHILQKKNAKELDDIYIRLTGRSDPLPWNARPRAQSNEQYGETPVIQSTYDIEGGEKIRAFRMAILEQAVVMQQIANILTGRDDMNAGLIAVLEPEGAAKYQNYLADPEGKNRLLEFMKQGEKLHRDKSLADTIISTLLKVGITVPVAILSKWTVGGFIESRDVEYIKTSDGDSKKAGGRVKIKGVGLTAQTYVGESGSVRVSGDIAGVRLEGNWNDPESRISNRAASILNAENKREALTNLVNTVNAEVRGEKYESDVVALGGQFLSAQERLLNLPDLPVMTDKQKLQQKDALMHNTMNYLARVEKAKGVRLQGVFAAFTPVNWMVGLSAAVTDKSASFDNVNKRAAVVEADALRNTVDEKKIDELLARAGVTKGPNGSYIMSDNTQIIPPTGQKVIFHFREIFLDDRKELIATPEFVSAQSKAESTVLTVKDNVKETVIQSSQEHADFARRLRRWYSTMMTEFGEYLGGGNFTEAEKTLKIVLTHISQNSRVSKDDKKIASALQKQFQGLSSEDKKMFMQDLQRYSSGSEASRKLGKSIRNNPNALSSDLEKAMDQVERLYNDGLARAFGEIYGVEKEVIMSQFKGMRGSLRTDSLQNIAEGGLAIVSYSQLWGNWKRTMHGALREQNMNAQFIGNAVSVTNPKLQAGVREQFRKQLQSQIWSQRNSLKAIIPESMHVPENEIIALMLEGKLPRALKDAGYIVSRSPQIKSYLSFEPHAECFNMGFVLTPVELSLPVAPVWESTYGRGAALGNAQVHTLAFGLGVGARWQKPEQPKNPDNPNPPERGETSDPENGTEPWRTPPGGEIPEGEKPVPEGEKPVPEGEKPVPEGEKPVPEGEKPVYTDPVIDGSPNVGSTDVSGAEEKAAIALQKAVKSTSGASASNATDLAEMYWGW